MQRVGELMWQAVQEFYRVLVDWVAGLPIVLDVRAWPLQVWLIVAGVLLTLLLLMRRPRRASGRRNWPELMISHGEIVLLDPAPLAAQADGGRRRAALLSAPEGAAFQLRMAVSNLNSYPMQLLELVLRVSGRRQPVVADASAVVPPHGAVDVIADLADLPGDSGTFELYLHGTRSRPRTVKLIVPVEWEPWNQRYRLRATGQRVERAGALPSNALLRTERGRRRSARLANAVRGAASVTSSAMASGFDRLAHEVRRGRSRFLDARAARAAAREARAAESHVLRPVPMSVPFGPGSRSETPLPSTGSGTSHTAPSATGAAGFEWPRGEQRDSQSPASQVPNHVPSSVPEQGRRRLDFPDEF